ncbi:unnamed protein product, partial [Callosobruchus maculatus]
MNLTTHCTGASGKNEGCIALQELQDFVEGQQDFELYPISLVVPFTAIYAVIFVTGVVGNIGTCTVIARNKHMQTATNCYLFSLACSDLLLLLSALPPEMYRLWSSDKYIFGEAFCIMQGFFAETSANASVFTITAFTVERYLAICHPFLSHTMSKLSRAVRYIAGIWITAMVLAIPQAIQFGVLEEFRNGKERSECTLARPLSGHAFEISTFIIFVGPMTLITILYVLIAVQLRKTQQITAHRGSRNLHQAKKRHPRTTNGQRRVIKMLS